MSESIQKLNPSTAWLVVSAFACCLGLTPIIAYFNGIIQPTTAVQWLLFDTVVVFGVVWTFAGIYEYKKANSKTVSLTQWSP